MREKVKFVEFCFGKFKCRIENWKNGEIGYLDLFNEFWGLTIRKMRWKKTSWNLWRKIEKIKKIQVAQWSIIKVPTIASFFVFPFCVELDSTLKFS